MDVKLNIFWVFWISLFSFLFPPRVTWGVSELSWFKRNSFTVSQWTASSGNRNRSILFSMTTVIPGDSVIKWRSSKCSVDSKGCVLSFFLVTGFKICWMYRFVCSSCQTVRYCPSLLPVARVDSVHLVAAVVWTQTCFRKQCVYGKSCLTAA